MTFVNDFPFKKVPKILHVTKIIKIFQQENFTRDKLNRALIRLERWLEGYSGFIKERRGTRAYVYELNLIVQL